MVRPRLISLLAILVLLLPISVDAQNEQPPGGRFFDDNETVHEPNIEAIAAIGVTAGCVPEGTAFCPEARVTRQQMASFVARALDLDPGPSVFEDVDPVGTHAANIGAIRQAGITLGCNTAGDPILSVRSGLSRADGFVRRPYARPCSCSGWTVRRRVRCPPGEHQRAGAGRRHPWM